MSWKTLIKPLIHDTVLINPSVGIIWWKNIHSSISMVKRKKRKIWLNNCLVSLEHKHTQRCDVSCISFHTPIKCYTFIQLKFPILNNLIESVADGKKKKNSNRQQHGQGHMVNLFKHLMPHRFLPVLHTHFISLHKQLNTLYTHRYIFHWVHFTHPSRHICTKFYLVVFRCMFWNSEISCTILGLDVKT